MAAFTQVLSPLGGGANVLPMSPGSGLDATKPAWGGPTVDELDLDARLVERCLQGDEGAWEDLVRTHTRRVYAICYRFTGRDSEAQDLTQDVLPARSSSPSAVFAPARSPSRSGWPV